MLWSLRGELNLHVGGRVTLYESTSGQGFMFSWDARACSNEQTQRAIVYTRSCQSRGAGVRTS